MLDKNAFREGIELLKQPVMPLVGMVQFLFMTGPFTTVAEVINELPEPIETDRTRYEHPGELLSGYLPILSRFEDLKNGTSREMPVVDEGNNPVDVHTAHIAHIQQEILKQELEPINSILCGPCGCTLCCVGPDEDMDQEFFEIPLSSSELNLFEVERYDSEQSRKKSAYEADELMCYDQPFYRRPLPALFHWQSGWSLIMPRESTCPNLQVNGQCSVYTERPEVCRRPQIFPYMIEPLEEQQGGKNVYRIRQSLLAITDCPYVNVLRDEIAEYAAASELQLVLNQNKA